MDYEVANGVNDGILANSHTRYGCCGIYYERNCTQDYPPLGKCSGSACTYPCLEIVNHNVESFTFGLGIAVLVVGCVLVRKI